MFTFLPELAVSVRRLHDVDKSGWMLFITLTPLFGSIWLLILMASESTLGENEYDANPNETQEGGVSKTANGDTVVNAASRLDVSI